jgi:dTDP-4-dehydrorhamnose reductase
MRVLVTGAAGMLGVDVCAALRDAGHEPLRADVRATDLTIDICDPRAVDRAFRDLAPDRVIHCAAFTDVDRAETEPDAAYRVNALGSWSVACACAELDVPLCAISTDFVFDGTKADPYTEFDTPNPLGVYGASKLAGEQCVRQACRRHWIVRTAWLFGVHGKSFPRTILRAARSRPELRVVVDQRGTPTFTVDLARTLVAIIDGDPPAYGTYHVTNTGVTTWYDFARKAIELADLRDVAVNPISANEWPTPVRRPANSALVSPVRESLGGPVMRSWEEALAEFVAAVEVE